MATNRYCYAVAQALHALATAKPSLCMPAKDPVFFVRFLAAYIKVPCLYPISPIQGTDNRDPLFVFVIIRA